MIIWINGAFGVGKTQTAFEYEITNIRITTDSKTIEEVVYKIAKQSQVTLLPDKRNGLKKKIDRIMTQLKHIR